MSQIEDWSGVDATYWACVTITTGESVALHNHIDSHINVNLHVLVCCSGIRRRRANVRYSHITHSCYIHNERLANSESPSLYQVYCGEAVHHILRAAGVRLYGERHRPAG
jgi:hypothetical protein